MAALFIGFLFIHCDFTLTSSDYLMAATVIYAACLLTAQLRTWVEHGTTTFATIEPSSHNSVRVTIPTTSSWSPGQHVFVRFLASGLHSITSHPFTICSLPVVYVNSASKDTSRVGADMVLYVWARGGFTARLSALAQQKPGRKIRVLLDGPYGGMKGRGLHNFDNILVIAGGAGAGFTFPIIEDFLRRYWKNPDSISTTSTESRSGDRQLPHMRVIIAVKTEAHRAWYEDVLRELLNSCHVNLPLVPTDHFLAVDVHVTDTAVRYVGEPEKEQAVSSSSSSPDKEGNAGKGDEGARQVARVYRGERPDLPALIRKTVIAKAEAESLGMAACGPSSMLFDVRNAAAEAQVGVIKKGKGEVWLYHEHFSW